LRATLAGATPRRKNSDQPTGGVRKDVCSTMQMIAANHTMSTPCAMK